MALSHSPSVVTNGLILYLDAANIKSYNGSGATWYDLSGNNNHASISSFVSDPVFSNTYGGSFYFNGITSKSYIQCLTNNNLTNLNDFTTIIWGRMDNFSALSYGRYYALDTRLTATTSGVGIGFDKETSTTASPFSFAQDASGYDEPSGPSTFTDSTIYMMGIVRSGANIQIIDSNSYSLISPSLAMNTLGTGTISFFGYRIGTWSSAGSGTTNYWWQGHIMSVCAFNRALSQQEIYQNFAAYRGRYSL